MHTEAIRLGSARETTRADGDGKTMELIPGQFYQTAGTGPLVDLGSARAETRADISGPRLELVPELSYVQSGDA